VLRKTAFAIFFLAFPPLGPERLREFAHHRKSFFDPSAQDRTLSPTHRIVDRLADPADRSKVVRVLDIIKSAGARTGVVYHHVEPFHGYVRRSSPFTAPISPSSGCHS